MAAKKRKAKTKPAKGATQGPIGNTTGVYIPVPKPNTSGGVTKIPIEATTPEEKSFLETKQEQLQGKIDDWVATQGGSKMAMAGGAMATALNQVLFPTALWELVPVGKVFKLIKKGKQAAEAALEVRKVKKVEKTAEEVKAVDKTKDAKKAEDKGGGRVDPKKQKPHKDCGDLAKYSKQKKNNGLEKDHTPSGKALDKATLEELKKRKDFDTLSDDKIASIQASVRNNALTIAIPPDIHSDGNTWRGRNTDARSTADSRDLKSALERDTAAIQDSMDRKDHGCSEKYASAAKELKKFDFEKHIKETISRRLKDQP